MDILDISAALDACDGLSPYLLRRFVEAYERLNGTYATDVLRRARLALGLPWPN